MSLFDDPVCRAAVLLYANTPWGRRQLCIDQDIPPGRSLIDIGPNRVTWLARQERPGLRQALRQARRDGPTETTSDSAPMTRVTVTIIQTQLDQEYPLTTLLPVSDGEQP